MDFEQLRHKAAELFPAATKFAITNPGLENTALESLNRLCAENYAAIGFHSHADCFAAAVPKLKGRLSLNAWCEADMLINGHPINITMRPLRFGAAFVHFELRHSGPLPGMIETGFLSRFEPLAAFLTRCPEGLLETFLGADGKWTQPVLF